MDITRIITKILKEELSDKAQEYLNLWINESGEKRIFFRSYGPRYPGAALTHENIRKREENANKN